MSSPEIRVSGPGPEGIHPTLRTGPLATGPQGPPEDQGRTKDHYLYTDEEWRRRLEAAIAETLRKRAAKRDERADHLERRRHGKAKLHAIKLARLRRPPSTDPE